MMKSIMFWAWLPVRALNHGFRYLFGHPVRSTIGFALVGVLFTYMSTLQVTQAAAAEGTHQRIMMMFPSAGVVAAVCAMTCGTLLMWMAEHRGKTITSWTEAPSLLSRPVAAPTA
jgi:hypothetical protein